MKFGVREICNVVLKAKAAQKVGKKIFYKNEPVMYFDTLKTSSMEGQSSTVYAQGGRGNPRLVAWEGERQVTFTMEDALISAEGLSILTGAGLIDAKDKTVYQHITEIIDKKDLDISNIETGMIRIPLSNEPYLPIDEGENFAYVMFRKDGDIVTEPYIPVHAGDEDNAEYVPAKNEDGSWNIFVKVHKCYNDANHPESDEYVVGQLGDIKFDSVLVDFYVAREAAAKQIEITPDKFGGNYYVEASTLFRNTDGVDMPAEFIIPNCKIQSNFTFTMASSGDPSSFTFTMDAFPDYTRFDHSKKVLAAIQIIEEAGSQDLHRGATPNGEYKVDGGIEGVDPHEDLWTGRIDEGNG